MYVILFNKFIKIYVNIIILNQEIYQTKHYMMRQKNYYQK